MQAPTPPSSAAALDLPLAGAPPPVKAPTPRPPPPASLQPESPGVFFSAAAAAAPLGTAHRRIAIAVDLSDESAYAVRWAVANYLRPGDAVVLLHVRPTSVLYGADWGAVDVSLPNPSNSAPTASDDSEDDAAAASRMDEDYDAFTASKADDFARPLKEAGIPYKIHIVRDHDMKERLCLEVERLALSAVIMGSKGFGAAARRTSKGRLGSVSDYCVHHCVCPVVVVRFPDDGSAEDGEASGGLSAAVEDVLRPVPEEEAEYHDAAEEHKGLPEGVTPVVPEEPEGEEQQGAVLQEAAQDEDQDADLPECPNHHPSSFEKDGEIFYGYCPTCFYPAYGDE